ncbi:hypothetical protein N802_11365 [Knoellia sinensis KCTC 19936]|uniref:DUF262 domain-containing protein n=1 Tax=Knoellia sinensis KCTC 19936 TaxID=1385520 RepID=A0A0A0IZ60_9MICO|nr:DUF262 domain-containing protein [Knoellia sinensis]KGN29774.1 hypothetical protein N802_11365 [Knoellia sinensis KCTC 19936]
MTGSPNVEARATGTVDWLKEIRSAAIPVFQRDYRWSEATCAQLLDDILRVAEAPHGGTHFIGSILSTRDNKGDRGSLTLVDGQQRVTTLMLLIAAIRDLAQDAGVSIADDASELLLSVGDQPTKLRPHRRHEGVVTELLTGQADVLGESTFETNYAFFFNSLTDGWQRAWDGLHRLEHVTIELLPTANAQQIFESLNSTGTALADHELIHNYIHMGRSHAEQDELENHTWIPIEAATGGATRAFWRDYLVLTAETHTDLTGDFAIYRNFRERFPDPRRDITLPLREEWLRLAGHYRLLLTPGEEPDPDIRHELTGIGWFEGTPRPLLLGMYDDYSRGRVGKDGFVAELQRLQTMFLRRAVVNLDRDIRMIGTMCREIKDGYPLEGIVRRTPEDGHVRVELKHGRVPHAGYVLRRMQDVSAVGEPLDIEHIYPQAPRSEWSSGDGVRWGDLDPDKQGEYRAVLNTLGNLTLLEASLNRGASNRPFADKKPFYELSRIAEVKDVLSTRATWDANAIRERNSELTERFLRIWPRWSDAPMEAAENLVRVVDLPRDAKRGYPGMFEYVAFGDQIWGDVHTSKELLVRVANELRSVDPSLADQTEYAALFTSEKKPRQSFLTLNDGTYLYVGWAHQYLLNAAQQFIEAMRMADEARVKLSLPTPDHQPPE